MSLIDSLVSYWPLGEASGGATDRHSTNHLSQAGSVGTAAGKVGTARSFPGVVGNTLSCPDSADLSAGDTDFTLACWVYFSAVSTYQFFAGKWLHATQNEYILFLDGGGAVTGAINRLGWGVSQNGASTNFLAATTFGAVSTGNWYHVVGWHDSINNVRGIAVNGGPANTAAYSAGVHNGTTAFRLGESLYGATYPLNGRLDEVGFWRRVLTADERAQLYNGGAGLAYEDFAPPPPVAYAPVLGSAIVYPDLGRVG